jgi:hypothetical protein
VDSASASSAEAAGSNVGEDGQSWVLVDAGSDDGEWSDVEDEDEGLVQET